MVKSETLFYKLLGIDTLLSFDSIIHSAEDFQLKLTTMIEQLNKALLAENEQQAESEALCRALCCYFDRRLTGRQNNALDWQHHSLVHYFYGHNDSENNFSLFTQLEALLRTESEVIFCYAWKLLMLLIQVEKESEALVSLRTTWRPRYFSRSRPERGSSEPGLVPWVTRDSIRADTPRLMVFIIGPFAGKWFSQSDLSMSCDNNIVWVVAEHVTSLTNRLRHLEENHSTMATLTFFPLLADGLENDGVMIEQINAWQHAFSSVQLPANLPCMLGLFTRLSQQRYTHDPDRAIWTGGLATPPYGHLKLESSLTGLANELDACDDGNDLYAVQRHALGYMFITWFAESRIMNALQALFDNTQLDLAGVMLADHGQGFIRHGAWSLWLEEKYNIVPGLSASIATPSLPDLSLPLPVGVAPPPPPLPVQETEAEPEPEQQEEPELILIPAPARCRNLWLKVAALLLLLALMAGGFYYYSQQNTGVTHQQWSLFKPLRALFGKPDAKQDSDMTLFTLTDNAPLFQTGSSNLVPGNEKELAGLVPKMMSMPDKVFLIIGHSDNTGSAAVNLALSTERARIIRDWLIKHSGLPASRFIVEGAGNTRPTASNDTKEGRARNRRVEIIPLSMQSTKD